MYYVKILDKRRVDIMDITESRKVINLIKSGEDIPTYKVGEAMGYSRQSINNKLKSDTLRFSEIIAVLKHFGYSIEISKDGMTLKL